MPIEDLQTKADLERFIEQRQLTPQQLQNLVSVAVVGRVVPAGALFAFGGGSAPDGYLLCDGSSVVRVDFPDLFDAIGTAYGAVDASHFTLPDLAGRVPVRVGSHADVAALGDSDGLADASRSPSHTHSTPGSTTGTHQDSLVGPPSTFDGGGGNPVVRFNFYDEHTHAVPSGTSGDGGGPYLVTEWIVKT